VVSAVERRLVVVVAGTGSSDSGASVRGVVRWADVVLDSRGLKTGNSRGSSDFRVTQFAVALVALPELHTGTLGVAVGRAGTVALLLLVVARHEELEGNRDEEEEATFNQHVAWFGGLEMDLRSDNSDGEAGGVELADGSERCRVCVLVALGAAEAVLGGSVAVTKRCVDVARARRSAVAGQDSDGNHGTAAENIEEDCEERKDLLAAEAACQQDSEDGVENDGARETLDGLLPARNVAVAISLHREKVAVDAEDDSSAAELECVKQGRAEPQDDTADGHCEW
jgi:hypothetical protein